MARPRKDRTAPLIETPAGDVAMGPDSAPAEAHGGVDGAGADVPPAAVEGASSTVERLRLVTPYAYYDDEGLFRAWPAGAVVTDPEEIGLLIMRGAPVEF